MKNILLAIAAILFTVNSDAQYVQINNTSGTATYGSLAATVTSTGTVTISSSWCTTSFGTSYWAGSGAAGSYIYTFNHPVYALKILSYALNGGPLDAGEYLQMYVNTSFYPLTPSNMLSYTDCGSSGSGPCYLYDGLLMGPVGTSADYNGGDFVITQCSGITSFQLYCNGTEEGVSYYVFVDTISTGAGVSPITILPPGTSTICVGGSDTLEDTTFGGTWSSSDGSIATVSGGIVNGVGAGVVTIYYTVDSCSVSQVITVNAAPTAGFIMGASSVCVGATITLVDTVSGGMWLTTNSNAIVSSGLVTGITPGLDTIMYLVSNSCGSAMAMQVITVNTLPVAGTISGYSSVCTGGNITLTDVASGGTWSSSSSTATITSGGVVHGVSVGIDTINYSVSNSCGTVVASKIITINAGPNAGFITGSSTVCTGSSITLADTASGGTWSSSDSHATITSGGVVHGVSVGTDTIKYSVSNSCGSAVAIMVITVNAAPNAGIITGLSTVCTGSVITLADTASGGTWSSSNGHATVSGGIVTGVSAGVDTIKYSVSNSCGTAVVNHVITVNAGPAAISPSGAVNICLGTTVTLTDVTTGGTWTSSASGTASVSGGVVTGNSLGTATITYTIGSCFVTKLVTVISGPSPISPSSATVCAGSTVTFTDTTSGGVWSTSSSGIVTVSGGIVTGVDSGIAVITYSVGSCIVTAIVTVNAGPAPISPSGVINICLGSTTTLTDATTGGTWTSSASGTASVSGGIVTGNALGTATITYTAGSCYVTKPVTVITGPAAISPTSAVVCTGGTVNLLDATAGGTWSSSASGTASVSGGVVTGVAIGTATITYTVGSCFTTATVTVNSGPAAITPSGPVSICLGSTVTLADATPFGTWTSTLPGTASVISTDGVVTGNAVGTATIIYSVGSCFVTKAVSVISGPAAISPSTATVCTGSTVTLTDATAGGTWATSAGGTATVSGGVVTGVAVGTATISYSVGSCYTTARVTVNATPSPIAPSGPVSLCIGNVVTLTDGTSGGAWSSSSGSATVSGGIVTGVSVGTPTISYTVGGCSATKIVSVNNSPGAISPASPTVCVGGTLTLTDAASGGIWSSLSTGTATIYGTGVVTGVAAGTTTISYTIGACFATTILTVNNLPDAGIITGTATGICATTATTLTDTVSGGTWSASNGDATVSSSGVVTGVTSGTDIISYTVGGSCGSASATYTINIVTSPAVEIIDGPSVICEGSFAIYTDSTLGGTWSCSNGNATITGSGVVTGVATGTDTIIYTYTNACGTAITTKAITISTLPVVGLVTGPTSVCIGGNITLNDATAGGTWSRTNALATVSGTGVVTGVSAGTDMIIYTVSNGCGTAADSATITVLTLPAPGTITGPAFVCIGSVGTYTDAVAGGIGTWSISNTNATLVTGMGDGVVTGVSLGTDIVSYSVSNMCGTSVTTLTITINPYPVAGVISGPLSVCEGSTITLNETMPGGVWSSGDLALASVTGTGIETGVVTGISTGTDTISYTISGGCAVVGTWATIEIAPMPDAGTITGATAVCFGSAITLADATTGGTWSGSDAYATVSSSGVVTGITPGTALVSYAVTNMCGTAYATSLITVDTYPTAGSISWTDGVCAGSAVTLIDSVPGGLWSASNGTATVIAPGVILGVTAGIDTIFYIVTNACGTADAYKILPVNPLPVIAPVSGSSAICVGSITTLADATTGGTWGSSNTAVATIDLMTGLLHGITPGTATISYTVTSSAGCPADVTYSITVDAIPVIPGITGTTHECTGATTTLADATTGGTWSSSNTAIATTDASGDVTGVSAGIATITYTVTNICGTSTVTARDTVIALPGAGTLSAASECAGATATMTDATTGGTWSSSNTTIATINPSTGVITGISAGTVTISYTVTNSAGCSATATTDNTVNALPTVAAITGTTNECLGATTLLADATTGGTWSSSNTATATVSSGLVTGLAGGIVTISYSVTNSSGCMGSATTNDTVNTIPVRTAITGTMHLCAGTTTTLADAAMWGSWTSTTPTVATIGATGIITGVSAGSDIIVYNVANSCGSAADSAIITVYAAPEVSPVTGAATTICAGATTILSDATTGGTWSSGNTAIATVGSTSGIVTGVAAGTVTITYTITGSGGCAAYATYNLDFGSYLGTSSVQPPSAVLCAEHTAYMYVVTSGSGLTYQWMRNGVIIPGATDYNYTASLTGDYSVLISNGSCEETITGTVVSNMTTPVISLTPPNMLYTGSYAGYQWYLNGTMIPGATSDIYFETVPGDYTLVVTQSGCSETSADDTITGGTGTGVKAINGNSLISIYPNPAATVLYIESAQDLDARILCADGRIVAEQTSAREINVSGLADGMYIIMLYDKDGLLVKTDRFVKRN